jgi:hypothetical protein
MHVPVRSRISACRSVGSPSHARISTRHAWPQIVSAIRWIADSSEAHPPFFSGHALSATSMTAWPLLPSSANAKGGSCPTPDLLVDDDFKFAATGATATLLGCGVASEDGSDNGSGGGSSGGSSGEQVDPPVVRRGTMGGSNGESRPMGRPVDPTAERPAAQPGLFRGASGGSNGGGTAHGNQAPPGRVVHVRHTKATDWDFRWRRVRQTRQPTRGRPDGGTSPLRTYRSKHSRGRVEGDPTILRQRKKIRH